jgi:hypothetical protein
MLDCTFVCIYKDYIIVKTYNESRIYNSILKLRFLQGICNMNKNSTDSEVAQPLVMKSAATGEQMKKLAVPVSQV